MAMPTGRVATSIDQAIRLQAAGIPVPGTWIARRGAARAAQHAVYPAVRLVFRALFRALACATARQRIIRPDDSQLGAQPLSLLPRQGGGDRVDAGSRRRIRGICTGGQSHQDCHRAVDGGGLRHHFAAQDLPGREQLRSNYKPAAAGYSWGTSARLMGSSARPMRAARSSRVASAPSSPIMITKRCSRMPCRQ